MSENKETKENSENKKLREDVKAILEASNQNDNERATKLLNNVIAPLDKLNFEERNKFFSELSEAERLLLAKLIILREPLKYDKTIIEYMGDNEYHGGTNYYLKEALERKDLSEIWWYALKVMITHMGVEKLKNGGFFLDFKNLYPLEVMELLPTERKKDLANFPLFNDKNQTFLYGLLNADYYRYGPQFINAIRQLYVWSDVAYDQLASTLLKNNNKEMALLRQFPRVLGRWDSRLFAEMFSQRLKGIALDRKEVKEGKELKESKDAKDTKENVEQPKATTNPFESLLESFFAQYFALCLSFTFSNERAFARYDYADYYTGADLMNLRATVVKEADEFFNALVLKNLDKVIPDPKTRASFLWAAIQFAKEDREWGLKKVDNIRVGFFQTNSAQMILNLFSTLVNSIYEQFKATKNVEERTAIIKQLLQNSKAEDLAVIIKTIGATISDKDPDFLKTIFTVQRELLEAQSTEASALQHADLLKIFLSPYAAFLNQARTEIPALSDKATAEERISYENKIKENANIKMNAFMRGFLQNTIDPNTGKLQQFLSAPEKEVLLSEALKMAEKQPDQYPPQMLLNLTLFKLDAIQDAAIQGKRQNLPDTIKHMIEVLQNWYKLPAAKLLGDVTNGVEKRLLHSLFEDYYQIDPSKWNLSLTEMTDIMSGKSLDDILEAKEKLLQETKKVKETKEGNALQEPKPQADAAQAQPLVSDTNTETQGAAMLSGFKRSASVASSESAAQAPQERKESESTAQNQEEQKEDVGRKKPTSSS